MPTPSTSVDSNSLAAIKQHDEEIRKLRGALDSGIGSFLGTFTGFSAAQQLTVYYKVTNGVVYLSFPSLSATSNANTFTMTGLPSFLAPFADTVSLVRAVDNGTQILGIVVITAAGTVTFHPGVAAAATAWTASGNKGVSRQTITYIKDT